MKEKEFKENKEILAKAWKKEKKFYLVNTIIMIGLIIMLSENQSTQIVVFALYLWACGYINLIFNKDKKFVWHENNDAPEPMRTLSRRLEPPTAWDIYTGPVVLFGIGLIILWAIYQYPL